MASENKDKRKKSEEGNDRKGPEVISKGYDAAHKLRPQRKFP